MYRIVVQFFPTLFRCERVAYKHLAPIIEERLKRMKEPNEKANRPVCRVSNLINLLGRYTTVAA